MNAHVLLNLLNIIKVGEKDKMRGCEALPSILSVLLNEFNYTPGIRSI